MDYDDTFRADFLRFGQCPGYERIVGQMEQSLMRYPKKIICFGAVSVGGLSAQAHGDGNVYLGCLCVIPEYRGIGTMAMEELERLFPEWKRIELVTPAEKKENIRFYTLCGFGIAGEEMDGSVRVVNLVKKRTQ